MCAFTDYHIKVVLPGVSPGSDGTCCTHHFVHLYLTIFSPFNGRFPTILYFIASVKIN